MLLILITVSAAVLLYAYSMGLMGSLQGRSTGQPYLDQVALEFYDWSSLSTLKLAIRNTCTVSVALADFIIAGVRNSSAVTFGSGCNSPNGILPVQKSCILTFPVPSGFTPAAGVAYAVKIGTKNGAVFSYSCIAGQSS
jgi:hypothetical protein